jgi:hypothetical protein
MIRKVWKPCSESRRASSPTIAVIGRSSGQSTLRTIRTGLAPSICAASISVGSIDWSPAR